MGEPSRELPEVRLLSPWRKTRARQQQKGGSAATQHHKRRRTRHKGQRKHVMCCGMEKSLRCIAMLNFAQCEPQEPTFLLSTSST